MTAGLLLSLVGGTAPAQEEPPATPPRPAIEVQVENPGKGRYRVFAALTVDASPLELAKAIVDFPNQCESGCKIPVPSVDRAEIVHGSFDEGRMGTWTYIDDVLDAAYFTDVTILEEPKGFTIRLASPEEDDLERWESPERPHEPFFHHVDGSWTLRHDRPGTTRIEYRMDMSSDRFLVNLVPSQVLRGAERHAAELLYFLSSLGRKALTPPPPLPQEEAEADLESGSSGG